MPPNSTARSRWFIAPAASLTANLAIPTPIRAETDQATRWLSFALLEAEKGFRRISGYDDMPELIVAFEAFKQKSYATF
jgi:hypothetical protein